MEWLCLFGLKLLMCTCMVGSALLSHITYYAQQQLSIEEEEDVQAPIMEVGSGGGGGDYRHRAAVSGPIQEQGE